MSQTVGTRRVVRSVSNRWIGGVAGGLGEHLSTPAWVFRVAFVLTALAGGIGIVAYALMWVFLPLDPDRSEPPEGTDRSTGGWDLTGVLGILALGLGVLLGLAALGLPIRVSLWGPVLIVGAGVILLWRQSDDLQRATIRNRAEEGVQATAALSDRQGAIRVLVGLGLVLLGLVAVIGPQLDLVTTGRSMAAAGAVVAGVVLIALPWISTWIKGLEAERYSAVRAEERAAMAARVHDSVLQTLTLIQRRADDPAEVTRLARAEIAGDISNAVDQHEAARGPSRAGVAVDLGVGDAADRDSHVDARARGASGVGFECHVVRRRAVIAPPRAAAHQQTHVVMSTGSRPEHVGRDERTLERTRQVVVPGWRRTPCRRWRSSRRARRSRLRRAPRAPTCRH